MPRHHLLGFGTNRSHLVFGRKVLRDQAARRVCCPLMWRHPQRMMATLKSRHDCKNNFTSLLSFVHCVPRLDAFAGDALAECAVLTTCWWMHEYAWCFEAGLMF